MQRYSYTISVRIWHPSITPDVITRVLGKRALKRPRQSMPASYQKNDHLAWLKGAKLESTRKLLAAEISA
jgi:hypothetical protein